MLFGATPSPVLARDGAALFPLAFPRLSSLSRTSLSGIWVVSAISESVTKPAASLGVVERLRDHPLGADELRASSRPHA